MVMSLEKQKVFHNNKINRMKSSNLSANEKHSELRKMTAKWETVALMIDRLVDSNE